LALLYAEPFEPSRAFGRHRCTPGRDYAAGDVWGCVGLWFSGRWYFNNADYLAAVHEYLDDRIWETPPFINYTG